MGVRIGNPAPLGLLAFGMTTLMLMYVEMGWVDQDFEAMVYGTALYFGGVGQALVAIFELLKGSSFSFAVFGSYGFFWLAWASVFVERHRTTSVISEFEYADGMTYFFAQWGILTFCFWTITWRKNVALIIIFFLLTSTFFLLAAANARRDNVTKTIGGYFGFFTAIGAFYLGVAELVNEEWGRNILPGLAPIHLPERLVLNNETIAKRISYDRFSNTLMLYFAGLQITTPSAVETIRQEVEKAILDARAPRNKVHVIVDYKNVMIANEIVDSYWTMVNGLESQYYLSVRRFAVSSFGTRQVSANPLSLGTRVTTLERTAASKQNPGGRQTFKHPPKLQDEDEAIEDDDGNDNAEEEVKESAPIPC